MKENELKQWEEKENTIQKNNNSKQRENVKCDIIGETKKNSKEKQGNDIGERKKKKRKKWTYENVKREALKYNIRTELRYSNVGAYNKAYKKGWLNEFFPKEIVTNIFKLCSGPCREIKPLCEFHKRKNSLDGYRGICKECAGKGKYKEKFKPGFKRCIGRSKFHCNEIKLFSEFNKNPMIPDGYSNICKKCESKYKKKYYKNNKIHIKNKTNEWNKKNPDKVKIMRIRYRKNNKDKINKDVSDKMKNDINFKLRCYLSKRIWNALKGITKSAKTMNLLGCSIKFLKQKFEKLFYDNMTWNNYGNYWHVDHIIPCKYFDLRNESEQKKCFHWTNLQPLTKKDNLEKGAKLNWIKK